jgi:predicted nucleic acid-binding protein
MFVDTNILVYATQITSPQRDAARTALQGHSQGGARLRLSRQILREYLAVVTRPQLFASPMTMAEALVDVERFAAAFEVLEDGPEVGARLAELCRSVRSPGARCTTPTSSRPCWPTARPAC